MCGRYYIAADDAEEELREIIESMNRRGDAGAKTSGDILPTDAAPVMAKNRRMENSVFAMKWGFTAANGGNVINARSETAAEKPMFRDGIVRRRCVIPASSYYEWEKCGAEKVKYAIRSRNASVTYMAGLYRFEASGPVFTILTRSPVGSIAFVHDRMPVLLPRELLNDWLNPQCPAQEVLDAIDPQVDFQRAQ